MAKKEPNPLLHWINPEHKPLRSALLFGWVIYGVLLGYLLYETFVQHRRPDWLFWVLVVGLAVLYLLFTVKVVQGYRNAGSLWRGLSPAAQQELGDALAKADILQEHLLLTSDYVCLYAGQSPQILAYADILWIYPVQQKVNQKRLFGKAPVAPLPQANAIVLGSRDGKLYRAYTGKRTNSLYTGLGNHLGKTVYGWKKEYRTEFRRNPVAFWEEHGLQ